MSFLVSSFTLSELGTQRQWGHNCHIFVEVWSVPQVLKVDFGSSADDADWGTPETKVWGQETRPREGKCVHVWVRTSGREWAQPGLEGCCKVCPGAKKSLISVRVRLLSEHQSLKSRMLEGFSNSVVDSEGVFEQRQSVSFAPGGILPRKGMQCKPQRESRSPPHGALLRVGVGVGSEAVHCPASLCLPASPPVSPSHQGQSSSWGILGKRASLHRSQQGPGHGPEAQIQETWQKTLPAAPLGVCGLTCFAVSLVQTGDLLPSSPSFVNSWGTGWTGLPRLSSKSTGTVVLWESGVHRTWQISVLGPTSFMSSPLSCVCHLR